MGERGQNANITEQTVWATRFILEREISKESNKLMVKLKSTVPKDSEEEEDLSDNITCNNCCSHCNGKYTE